MPNLRHIYARLNGALNQLVMKAGLEYRAALGDASDFRRRILFPQLSIFVCLVLLGSAEGEDIGGLFLKLVVIAYLLFVYALVRSRAKLISFRVLEVELLVLIAILSVGAGAFNLPPLAHVFVPAGLLVASLFLARCSWRLVAAMTLSISIVLVLFGALSLLLGQAGMIDLVSGMALMACMSAAGAALAEVAARSAAKDYSGAFEKFMSSGLDADWRQPSESMHQVADVQHEEESEVSHLVNNALQEMVEEVDALHTHFSGPGGAADDQTRRVALERLGAIERALAFVSWTVSDSKLLLELGRRSSAPRIEKISLAALKREIESYGRALARRGDQPIEVLIDGPSGESAKIAGVDYLFSVLRRLLRRPYSSEWRGSRFEVIFRAGEKHHCLELCSRAGAGFDERTVELLEKLVGMSGGVFFQADGSRGEKKLICELPCFREPSLPVVALGDWMLLVDDAPQVVVFYERVAVALGMKSFSASSRAKALELLETHGEPRIAITDVKLADGEADELIVELRRRCGEQLPLLVVSGSSEALERLRDIPGRCAFLTKPVNRAALIDAISSLLGGV